MQSPSFSAATELRALAGLVTSNLRGSVELRTSFALQVVGMAINNISFLAAWVLFFLASGPVNGWSTVEVAALQGFMALTFGISFSLFGGSTRLPEMVRSGALDGLLTTPRTLVGRILAAHSLTPAIGDALFGLIILSATLIYAHATPEQLLVTLALIPPSILLFTSMGLAAGCTAFFLPDGQIEMRQVFDLFLFPSLNPSGVLGGAARAFFLVVIPAIAASALPVEAIRDTSWKAVGIVWAISLAWAVITYVLLGMGVRRYESGNLTGARV